MMKIVFSPIRKDAELTLEKQGETLIVNGQIFDFSTLAEGGEVTPEGDEPVWFAAPVRRENGHIVCALFLPHGADAPEETLYPEPLENLPDGAVAVPAHSKPETGLSFEPPV